MRYILFIILLLLNLMIINAVFVIILPKYMALNLFILFALIYLFVIIFSTHLILIGMGARLALEHEYEFFYNNLKNICFNNSIEVPKVYYYSSKSNYVKLWLSSVLTDAILINRNFLVHSREFEQLNIIEELAQEKLLKKSFLRTARDSILLITVYISHFLAQKISFWSVDLKYALFIIQLIFFNPLFVCYYLVLGEKEKAKKQMSFFWKLNIFSRHEKSFSESRILTMGEILSR